jgi:hypothetical protein
MTEVSDEFRNAVSEWTGVPSWLLKGDTIDAVWDSAKVAADWKQATSPQPPPATAAVPAYPVSQFSRESLAYLTADQITTLWREGRLEGIGAPAPGARHNGERHAAP